jgi:uncharacterized RDD family membrane protein YckC
MIWEIDEQKPAIEGLDAHGRPDPAYAAALGLLRAPFGRRSLAFAIDVAIWVVVLVPLLIGAAPLLLRFAAGSISAYGFVNHPDFVLAVVMASASTLLALVLLIVQLVLHGRRGVTIGKAVTGIRSVDVCTLERPRVGPVLLRFLLLIASGIVPVLGPAFLLASPTFDPERRGRGLHDKATGVWLVDARRGLDPYDQKRMRVARKVVKAEPTPGRAALPSLATPTDPAAQPEYRPGGRVSAGVLGMARPHETSVRPSVGLPPIAPATAPEPAEAGKPVLGGYRRSGRQAAPAAPAPQSAAPAPQPAAPAPQPEPVVRFGLRWDSGESIPIAAPVLLGRNPDAAEHPGATAIALADDSRSLSKTHLLVRPVPGGLEIVDCRSTNGSGLIRGGTEYGVAAGTPTTATEGDMIRLGDRVAAVVRL